MVPNMRAQLQPHSTYKWVHSLVNVESTAHHDKASNYKRLRPLSQLAVFPQNLCMFPVSAIAFQSPTDDSGQATRSKQDPARSLVLCDVTMALQS